MLNSLEFYMVSTIQGFRVPGNKLPCPLAKSLAGKHSLAMLMLLSWLKK